MKTLAIIPARGGSKRIPRKNVKTFMGRPIIAYSICAALDSGLFDEVMVSTDDKEIAAISSGLGAKVPFLRSAATSGDGATTRDVMLEVLGDYSRCGKEFDRLCCIYPCAPLLTSEILQESYRRFVETDADMLMPVVRYSFPVQRALKIGADGLLEYREQSEADRRSQDLEPMFHDAGVFYWTKVRSYLVGEVWHRAFYEFPEIRVQDIDSEEDWRLAEVKYRVLNDV